MSPLPQVELSFGASNGAWDDRALITACDAAMAEFHVSKQSNTSVIYTLMFSRPTIRDQAHGSTKRQQLS